jgi:hypothetical protein
MAAVMGAMLTWGTPSQARVTAIGYETLRGRVFGEPDPADPHNAIIRPGSPHRIGAWFPMPRNWLIPRAFSHTLDPQAV